MCRTYFYTGNCGHREQLSANACIDLGAVEGQHPNQEQNHSISRLNLGDSKTSCPACEAIHLPTTAIHRTAIHRTADRELMYARSSLRVNKIESGTWEENRKRFAVIWSQIPNVVYPSIPNNGPMIITIPPRPGAAGQSLQRIAVHGAQARAALLNHMTPPALSLEEARQEYWRQEMQKREHPKFEQYRATDQIVESMIDAPVKLKRSSPMFTPIRHESPVKGYVPLGSIGSADNSPTRRGQQTWDDYEVAGRIVSPERLRGLAPEFVPRRVYHLPQQDRAGWEGIIPSYYQERALRRNNPNL